MKLKINTTAASIGTPQIHWRRLARYWRNWSTAGVVFLAISGCGPNEVASANGRGADLDAVARQAVKDSGFSGSVLVALKGKVVLDSGYGTVDGKTGERITKDTVFDIGSLTKQFTAAAILRLVDQGRVKLEDPIARYFPDAPPDKAGITVLQLLTHTSGLSDHAPDDWEVLSKDVALSRIFGETLEFPPGSKFGYSNSGYTLLAALIESVTSEPYTKFMETAIFKPFGLTHTGFFASHDHWRTSVLAHGIFAGTDKGLPSSWPGPYWGPMGNGEILSTTQDMYRWFRAVRENKVAPEPLTRQVFTPHIKVFDKDKNGVESFYGFGWGIKTGPNGTLITHGGAGLGGNAEFAYFVEQDTLIVVLSNQFWPEWAPGGTAGRVGPARPALALREKLWAALNPSTGGS